MTTLERLLTCAERDAIRAPIERARAFPGRAFIDPGFHAFEVKPALAESWIAISFSTAIIDPGDILPLTPLGYPLLLVRGTDGVAGAFHNVCPYNGCEVATGPRRGLKEIITPYHGRRYAPDGTLLEAHYLGRHAPGRRCRPQGAQCRSRRHTLSRVDVDGVHPSRR